ncbi:MAG: hypothetical protein ACKO32_10430 [Planctomycetia bacterium]
MMLSAALLLLSRPVFQAPPPPVRGRDPWVFRCVLDKRPRMVVFALSEQGLWCAYDAQTMSFYKCWQGNVRLTGSVYDTSHGPQPTVQGTEYLRGFDEDNWQVFVGGKGVAAEPRFGGYWIHDGRATLLYHLILPDGRNIQVRETPEFTRPGELFSDDQIEDFVLEKGDLCLWRSFQVVECPEDVQIALRVGFKGTSRKLVEMMEREDPDKQEGWLVLSSTRPGNNMLLFFKPKSEVR